MVGIPLTYVGVSHESDSGTIIESAGSHSHRMASTRSFGKVVPLASMFWMEPSLDFDTDFSP